MGKLLSLFKANSLPPEIESQVRILDLQFDQMETKIKELEQAHERTLHPKEIRSLNKFERRQEAAGHMDRISPRPADPTNNDLAVLKVMVPPGRQIDASSVAQLMRANIATTQKHLDELERKDYISKTVVHDVKSPGEPSIKYTLTAKGVKVFIDHTRAE